MRLTDAAAQRIVELTKRADSEIVGLRVGIKNGGCAGSPIRSNTPMTSNRPTRSSRTRASRSWSIPRPYCSCSAPRWTTRPTRCRPSSSSTTRTRSVPAAAASPCSWCRPRSTADRGSQARYGSRFPDRSARRFRSTSRLRRMFSGFGFQPMVPTSHSPCGVVFICAPMSRPLRGSRRRAQSHFRIRPGPGPSRWRRTGNCRSDFTTIPTI